MVQAKLTTEMQTQFDYNFHNYFERKSVALSIMPWTTAQVTYMQKWYVPKRLPEPIITKNFSTEMATEPQYSELTNPTAAISLDLEVQDTDLKIAAQTSGMAIDTAWASLAAQQMDLKILKQLINGDDTTKMAGLLDSTSGTSTYNTIKWNAATGPHLAVNDCLLTATSLWSMGHIPPYELLLGHNLLQGWNTTVNAAPVALITNGDMAMRYINGNVSGDTSNLFWVEQTPASPVANMIYPLPAPAANDGRFIILKPVQDGDIAIQGVWCEPLHSTEWQFDGKTDRWHTKMMAMIGLKVFATTAIADHDRVDFA